NVVTYDVVIKVDNSDMKLKPGMTANVSIIVAAKDGVLKIPNSALRFRPSEKEIAAAKANGSNSDKPSKDTKPGTPGTESGRVDPAQKGQRRHNVSADGAPSVQRSDARKPDGQGGMTRRAVDGTRGSFDGARGAFRRAGGDERRPDAASSANVSSQPTPRKYPVWILENDKPKQAIITVGISDGSFTEVTSGDLKENQTVITGSSTKTSGKNNNTNQPPRPPGGLFR
ncbi:MAG TPA: hypothetical protein VHO84_00965, partial [Syntrophorhabdaceae bacterium]|nr:hypothetical protein [Syntrophorhabdaceae bacterium]